jgi:LAGLIDADG DNA endonuclease family
MFYKFDDELNRYVKIVPKDIDNLMTPVVLAHLIMGDGNLKKLIILYVFTPIVLQK